MLYKGFQAKGVLIASNRTIWISPIWRFGQKYPKSRLGLLNALVKAQRGGSLDTRCLGSRHPTSPVPDDPVLQQQQQAREHWLEQQAQQAWLRDMQRFGIAVEQLKPPACCPSGGVS